MLLPTPALRRSLGVAAAALVATALAGGLGSFALPSSSSASSQPAPRNVAGYTVTGGAAPGYVEDRACAVCHAEIAVSFAEVGMGRSFYRPRRSTSIEDFAAPPFVHAASRQVFRFRWEGETLVFRRWQVAPDGSEINALELPVAWIVGSGNHARTYLTRAPGGELFQLPLGWFAEGGWGMSPGFDRPDHDGLARRVRRECMFCHNGYFEVSERTDRALDHHVFPEELPEGIGCQRCHGPGAEHVDRALGGVEPLARVRAAIVNPAKLPPARREEACFQCHLQPSVAVPGVRRFGRGVSSYRPGEPLADDLVAVDVTDGELPAGERFEINHHAYRLRQSRCWQRAAGELWCGSCHDPHAKPPKGEREARVRGVCQGCHGSSGADLAGCRRPDAPAAGAADTADCAACHMPARRPQDVVRATMTDHRIGLHPERASYLDPRAERDAAIVEIRPLDPPLAAGESPPVSELELTAAAAEALGPRAAPVIERLFALLAAPASGADAAEPWATLASARLRQRRWVEAEAALAALAARRPDEPTATDWLALARAGQGRLDDALALLRTAAAANPERAATRYNLGRLLLAAADREDSQNASALRGEAERELAAAVALRPVLSAGRIHLARLRLAAGRTVEAIADLRQALAYDPGATDAYLELARALDSLGETAEARRLLAHAATAARDPARLAAPPANFEGAPRDRLPGQPGGR